MSSYIVIEYKKISMHSRSENRDVLVGLSSSLSLISIQAIESPVVFLLLAPGGIVNRTVCLH